MRALSIRQPWAWLIATGKKNIENRRWSTTFRGRVYIHAGQRWDDEALEWLLRNNMSIVDSLLLHSRAIPRGGIIGEVDITGCVTESNSMWFAGPYGFTLSNAKLYPQLVPYKGRLGFFEVPEDIAAIAWGTLGGSK